MDYVAAEGEQKEKGGKVTKMGRKAIVHYGLYRSFGFVNPKLATETGFNGDDLALFWQALQSMWDKYILSNFTNLIGEFCAVWASQ
jgi:CRISPR-associated protein Csd2